MKNNNFDSSDDTSENTKIINFEVFNKTSQIYKAFLQKKMNSCNSTNVLTTRLSLNKYDVHVIRRQFHKLTFMIKVLIHDFRSHGS